MNEQPSTKAIWALVLGILSLAGCSCFAAIPAIVLGSGEKAGIGRVGWILGWISLVLHVIAMIFAMFVFLIAAIADH